MLMLYFFMVAHKAACKTLSKTIDHCPSGTCSVQDPIHYQTRSYDQAGTQIRYATSLVRFTEFPYIASDRIVPLCLIVDRGLNVSLVRSEFCGQLIAGAIAQRQLLVSW